MPKRRYERREPTHNWQQIKPLLKDTAQFNYEVIRPVVLWGQTPKERGVETGVSPRTIYYRANLFDQAGMASLSHTALDSLLKGSVYYLLNSRLLGGEKRFMTDGGTTS